MEEDTYVKKEDIIVAGGIYLQVGAYEAVVDGNLVTSIAWPGNVGIIRRFVKLLGAEIEI